MHSSTAYENKYSIQTIRTLHRPVPDQNMQCFATPKQRKQMHMGCTRD